MQVRPSQFNRVQILDSGIFIEMNVTAISRTPEKSGLENQLVSRPRRAVKEFCFPTGLFALIQNSCSDDLQALQRSSKADTAFQTANFQARYGKSQNVAPAVQASKSASEFNRDMLWGPKMTE